MKRDYKNYLIDILENSKDIIDFVKNINYINFKSDKKTINAVVRSLEVIGEAANHLPKNIRDKYKKIPWDNIINMRNRLIHEYFGVDIEAVWQTIIEDIPNLIKDIEELIKKEFIEEK